MRWPKVVKSGTLIETPTSLMDFLPTLQEVLKDDSIEAEVGSKWANRYSGIVKTLGPDFCSSWMERVFTHY